jgi:elongation factor 2
MSQTSSIRNVAVLEPSASTIAQRIKLRASDTTQESHLLEEYNTIVHHTLGDTRYHVNLLEKTDDYSIKIVDGIFLVLNCTREPQTPIIKRMQVVDAELITSVLMLDNIEDILHYTANRFYEQLKSVFDLTTRLYVEREQTLTPNIGTVCFGSSKHGWCFSIPQVAKLFANKFDCEEHETCTQLWGEHYYDDRTKNWTTKEENKLGFEFVYDMLQAILSASKAGGSKLALILSQLGITLTEQEKTTSNDRFHVVMRKKFPLEETVLNTIVQHLPSPSYSQATRYTKLYRGPEDLFQEGIRNCLDTGPTMFYVANAFDFNGNVLYFGRLFSGTLTKSDLFVSHGPERGSSIDIVQSYIPNGKHWEMIKEPVPGQILCIIASRGPKNKDSNTIVSDLACCGFTRPMLKQCPYMETIHLNDNSEQNRDRIISVLKQVCGREIEVVEDEEHIHFQGETIEQVERVTKVLKQQFSGEFYVESQVRYRETVTAVQTQVAMSKSPNKHNRIYMTCEPLLPEIIDGIMHGQDRRQLLTINEEWRTTNPRICVHFPGNPNLIVNRTKGIERLNEVLEYIERQFTYTTKNYGVLTEEPIYGVQYNLEDIIIHVSRFSQSNGPQMGVTTRRVLQACQLMAEPKMMQAVMHVTAIVPELLFGKFFNVMNECNGIVFQEYSSTVQENTSIFQCYIPAKNCRVWEDLVSTAIEYHYSFSHWEIIPGSPFTDSNVIALVASIRKRKGLKEEIPELGSFVDKL